MFMAGSNPMRSGGVLYETDAYREWIPPVELRAAVECMWVRRADGRAVRVLPDACTDIVWRSATGAIIAGPDTGPVISPTRPGEVVVGVRLRPGAGGAAYGLPLSELRDQRVAISQLGLDPRGELPGELDPLEALIRLSRLAARLTFAGPPDRAVQTAVSWLTNPRQRVDRVAADLGFSQRQLRRRFHDAVGYGPKTLQRILRLQRFLALSDIDLARAAAEAGYADQAHLAREARQLTGLRPSALTRG
jgi:AraC-like DNA-binding protein